HELVAAQCTALQFALVTCGREHLESFAADAFPLEPYSRSSRHGKGLLGNGVAILEAGVADIVRRDLRKAGELLRDPEGVGAAFPNAQQHMTPLSVGLESEPLADQEILWSTP